MPSKDQKYRSVSLNESMYDELINIGIAIAEQIGIKPLSVPEVIAYLKRQYLENGEEA